MSQSMITNEAMAARVADVHARNVAAGWWTNHETGESLKGNRSPLNLLALVHSEVSEALEGDRKNLQDDKLPHRSMYEVELADTVIRVWDMAGGFDLDLTIDVSKDVARTLEVLDRFPSRSEALAVLHLVISSTVVCFIDNDDVEDKAMMLALIVRLIYVIAERFDLDLDGAIDEKLRFNAQRADHKPENRKLEGGKAY